MKGVLFTFVLLSYIIPDLQNYKLFSIKGAVDANVTKNAVSIYCKTIALVVKMYTKFSMYELVIAIKNM